MMHELISADSHVVEANEVFSGLTEKFGDDAPRVMNTDGEIDAIVIPSQGLKGTGAGRLGLAGLRLRDGAKLVRRVGIRSGAARHIDQDADGLAMEILYPGYFGMFSIPNIDLLVACQKNYNDWVFDYAAQGKGRLHGLAAIPLQDPEAGLAELKRVIGKGFKGVCIPCTSPEEKP